MDFSDENDGILTAAERACHESEKRQLKRNATYDALEETKPKAVADGFVTFTAHLAAEASKQAAVTAAAHAAKLKWERDAAAKQETEQQAWSETAAQLQASDAAAKVGGPAQNLGLASHVVPQIGGPTLDP